jgi:predicted kinase
MLTPRIATLVLTMGLPRSGKSSWAIAQDRPVVNRDAIRLALHGQAYLQEAEDMVTVLEDNMVRSLIIAGHSTVIIDACHLNNKHVKRWKDFKCMGLHVIHVIYERFPTSAKECVLRAMVGDRKDLIPVIERMWGTYGPTNPWIERK